MRTNDPSNYEGCGYVQWVYYRRRAVVGVRDEGGEREDLGKSTYNNRSKGMDRQIDGKW